jgi:hypothetical protein
MFVRRSLDEFVIVGKNWIVRCKKKAMKAEAAYTIKLLTTAKKTEPQ